MNNTINNKFNQINFSKDNKIFIRGGYDTGIFYYALQLSNIFTYWENTYLINLEITTLFKSIGFSLLVCSKASLSFPSEVIKLFEEIIAGWKEIPFLNLINKKRINPIVLSLKLQAITQSYNRTNFYKARAQLFNLEIQI